MDKKIYSLDEICQVNNYVLLDTCAFENYFDNPFSESKNLEGKTKNQILLEDRSKWWIEQIKKHREIHVTENVLNEIRRGYTYNYKKAIKKNRGKLSGKLVKYQREIQGNKRLRVKAVNLLKNEKKVLNFKEESPFSYGISSEGFEDLYEIIGETDFDLLISARILRDSDNLVAILSKDLKMFDAYKRFLEKNKEECFDSYLPRGKFSFQKY